jgi:folate-binding protein YgfZ
MHDETRAGLTVDDSLAREYAAGREGAGLADLPDLGVLRVTGPTRLRFLQGLLSNDVAGLADGEGCLAALMDVKGRLVAMMRLLAARDAVLLEMPRDRLETVESLLVHYRVAAPVRFAAGAEVVMGLLGPEAPRVLAQAGRAEPPTRAGRHAEGTAGGHAFRAARAADLPGQGYALHCAPEAAEAVRASLRAAGAEPIGPGVLDVLRVEEGRPWYGRDVGPEHLLHETGLLAEYHSSTKGCYVGQEVVARLEGRGGHVNKRLRRLRLSRPAAAGDEVSFEGEEVGRLTTAVVSPRRGPLALAFLHRRRSEPGDTVEVGGAAAVVEALAETP